MATTPAKKKTTSRVGQSRLDSIDSPIVTGEIVSKKKEIAKAKHAGGRPTMYTPAVVDEICERIAMGESLLRITQDSHMPDRVQVFRWIHKYEEFRNKYARAKENQADAYEEMMLDTARTEEDVARARLIVDTMKWTASKLKPKKYGDKLDLTSDGKALPTPLLGGVTIENKSNMTLGTAENA